MRIWLTALAARVRAFFTSAQLDRDFDEEIESHVAMLTEDNVRRGMSHDAARRAALIRIGGAAALREQHRAARSFPAFETMLRDLRFALRLVARGRGVSGAAIIAIALGIGANAVGFTIVHGALLRGLPFEDSDQLYVITWQNRSGRRSNVAQPELQDWRAQSRAFAALAAYVPSTINISDDRGLPEQAQATLLTANGFGVVRQQPLLGRDFTPADERPGAEPVVIIGHAIWKNRYAADRAVIGRTLRVDGRPATIVGVMPEGMRFPDAADIWAPFIPTAAHQSRSVRPLRVFGRLADDSSRAAAQTELAGIAQQLQAAYPGEMKDLLGVRVETFTERFIGGAGRPMMLTVMGAVVFLLLIACANVANLLLSQSPARAREVAVRLALGATRGRIVGQLLLESLVLGLIGGALGLLVAFAGVGLMEPALQGSMPYWVVFEIDYVVIAYVAGICVLTTVLFGLAPALHVSKANTNDVLKDGGRGAAGSRRQRRFTGAMVVAEIALTIVLLVGAGTMVRSFVSLYNVDLGIPIDELMTMRVQLPAAKYATPEARRAFFDRLEPRLASIPGVSAAAVTDGVPPLDGGERILIVEGRPPETQRTMIGTVTITPRFFDVVGVPLLRGRGFSAADGAPGSEAVIVNERLAAQYFPGEDPIGRRIRFTERQPPPGRPQDPWRTIVGISGRILHGSPTDAYLNAVAYIPYRQETPAAASLLVRSSLPAASVMDAVRREVEAIDRDQPVLAIRTVRQVLENDRWWQRTWAGLFGAVAAIALTLSAVGLYAVMAYSVTQRTQEIGVRMALGAARRQVSWLVLRRGLRQAAAGMLIGFGGSWILRRVLPGGMEGITPHDPLAIAAIAAMLTAVSAAACLIPARRAARVDPVVALRE